MGDLYSLSHDGQDRENQKEDDNDSAYQITNKDVWVFTGYGGETESNFRHGGKETQYEEGGREGRNF